MSEAYAIFRKIPKYSQVQSSRTVRGPTPASLPVILRERREISSLRVINSIKRRNYTI